MHSTRASRAKAFTSSSFSSPARFVGLSSSFITGRRQVWKTVCGYKVLLPMLVRMRTIFVGAAPMNPEMLEFFIACRMPCYEVYGMTELTAASHGNYGVLNKIGTIGKPVPHCQHKLGPGGELLVKVFLCCYIISSVVGVPYF